MDSTSTTSSLTHTYLLLDRSGSMFPLVDDVVGGVNAYVASVVADEPDAPFTLVQFDGPEPHDVVLDAIPVREVGAFTADRYQPRGNTPLLDATGAVISKAAERERGRRRAGLPAEDVVVVTVTDGEENASSQWSRPAVAELVKAKEEAGWTFIYLSAHLDAYAEAGMMGYGAANVQRFRSDGAGSRKAFAESARARTEMRHHLRTAEALRSEGRTLEADDLERRAKRDVFGGAKHAEADLDDDPPR